MIITSDRPRKRVTTVTSQEGTALTGLEATVTNDHDKNTFVIGVRVTSMQVAQVSTDAASAPDEVSNLVKEVVTAALRKAIDIRDANMVGHQAQLNLFNS